MIICALTAHETTCCSRTHSSARRRGPTAEEVVCSSRTVVSARSLGEVNVQTLMEKMGGGGHLTTAGTQVELSIEETVDEIKELIRDLQ